MLRHVSKYYLTITQVIGEHVTVFSQMSALGLEAEPVKHFQHENFLRLIFREGVHCTEKIITK